MQISLRLGVFVLVLALASASSAQAYESNNSEPGSISSARKLELLREYLPRIQSEIDVSQFDLNALMDTLDFDAQSIIDFVVHKVRFEQYPGLLRGAKGTLMSNAGNSLDQSVLLATLLHDAGYDARIVRSSLSSELARALLGQIEVSTNFPAPFKNLPAAETLLVEMWGNLGNSSESSKALLSLLNDDQAIRQSSEYAQTLSTARHIWQYLPPSDVESAGNRLEVDLLKETQDYFWVEFRESSAGPWKPVHPAFAGSLPVDDADSLEPLETFSDSVPAKYQHRIRFSAYLDQRLGGNTTTHKIAGPFEWPASGVSGLPVEFTIVPMDLFSFEQLGPESLPSAMKNADIFVAILSEGSNSSTSYFNASGSVVDPLAASSPAAGLFSKVGDRFGRAAGAVSEADDPDRFVGIEKIRIKYEIVTPGGQTTEYSRDIYTSSELTGKDSTVGERISQTVTFMPMTGTVPPAYLLAKNLEKIASFLPLLELQMDMGDAKSLNSKNVLSRAETAAVETRWIGHLQLYSMFDRGDSLFTDAGISYRSGINLIGHEVSMNPASPTTKIDVVSNEKRAFEVFDHGLSYSRQLVMKNGIWETRMEGFLTSAHAAQRFNVFEVMDKARAAGAKITLIKKVADLTAISGNLPDSVITRAQADLDRGYWLVAPESIPAGLDMTAWWRIDSLTGQTLGVGSDGRGVEITEAMVTKVFAVTTITGFACMGYMGYNGASGMATITQCGKLALAAGGATAAAVYAAAAASAAGATAVVGGSAAQAWQIGGIGGLFLLAILEMLSLDPTQ